MSRITRTILLGSLFWGMSPHLQAAESVSMVIAPFKNITQNPDDNWLQESFSENLTMGLGQVQSVRLVERTELKKLLQEQGLAQSGLVQEKSAPKLGKMVGAKYVVLGNYQKVGPRILVNVKVVNVETGAIEPQTLTQVKGEFKNLFEIQENLAAQLVQKLKLKYSQAEQTQIQQSLDFTRSTQAHQYYIEAKLLHDKLGDKNFVKAIELLQKALKEDPNYAQAHAELSTVYSDRAVGKYFYDTYQPKDVEKAEQHALKAVRLAPKEPWAYRALSKAYLAKNERDKAMEAVKKGLEFKKDTPSILHYLSLKMPFKAYVEPGSPERYEKELKALGADMEDPKVLFTLGSLYFAEAIYNPDADPTISLKLYEKAHRLNPHNPFSSMTLGSAYLLNQQFDKARQIFEKIAAENNDNPILLYFTAQMIQGPDPQKALDMTQRVIELKPKFAEAYIQQAKLYLYRMKDPKTSEKWFQKAKPLLNTPDAYVSAGRYLLGVKKYPEAEEYLKKSLSLWRSDGAINSNESLLLQYHLAQNDLGQAYLAQKKYALALKEFQDVLRSSDVSFIIKAKVYQDMARMYSEQKQPEKAVEAYQNYLKLMPKHFVGKDAQALYQYYYLESELQKSPDNPSLLNDLGQAAMADKAYADAENYLSRALKLDANNPVIHYNLGLLYLMKNQHAEAKAAFEKAVMLKPDYAKAHYNLGVIAYQAQDLNTARAAWNRALKADPSFKEARQALESLSSSD